MFGHNAEDFSKLDQINIFDPDDNRVHGALDIYQYYGNFNGELRFIRKDHSSFPGETHHSFFCR